MSYEQSLWRVRNRDQRSKHREISMGCGISSKFRWCVAAEAQSSDAHGSFASETTFLD
jgi:hypothetical protein